MKKIILLTDYKGHFGSKRDDIPYRSGMDLNLVVQFFNECNYEPVIMNFAEVNFRENNLNGIPCIYTCTEEPGLKYKSFVEDIVLGLEIAGVKLIPPHRFLRATNNKVFMEILRDLAPGKGLKNLKSRYYGSLEEFINSGNRRDQKYVAKKAVGAKSTGVYLAQNSQQLMKKIRYVSRSCNYLYELKDKLRTFKHKGYITDSLHLNKFVVQNFVPDLYNDWKILVYGSKYYALKRNNREKDFRASGSGNFEFTENIPHEILDFAGVLCKEFDLPVSSFDIAFNGKDCFLFEFQAVYFGTTTLVKSPFWFEKHENNWQVFHGKSILEKEYVQSIIDYLNR